MKKLLLAALPILWVTLLFYACRKDNLEPGTYPAPIDYTVLPPATQTGANTFGCLVDGEVWVPRVPLLAVTYRDISSHVSEKNGTGAGGVTCNLVDLDKRIDNWLSISFGNNYFQTKQFCFPTNIGVTAHFKKTNGDGYLSNYFDTDENCITITKLDTTNNIISGTFQFTMYNDTINKNDKVIITDGRFDLKYSAQ